MATHIQFNPATIGGGRLKQLLTYGESYQDGLIKELATFQTLLNGDGTQTSHFTALATPYYGFATDTDAKASWDELNSVNSKVNSDASVSSVMTAIKQAANKHR